MLCLTLLFTKIGPAPDIPKPNPLTTKINNIKSEIEKAKLEQKQDEENKLKEKEIQQQQKNEKRKQFEHLLNIAYEARETIDNKALQYQLARKLKEEIPGYSEGNYSEAAIYLSNRCKIANTEEEAIQLLPECMKKLEEY